MALRRSTRVLSRAATATTVDANKPVTPASAPGATTQAAAATPLRSPSVTLPTPTSKPPPSARKSSSAITKAELPILLFPDPASFDTWLSANASTSPGLWLKIAKKSSGIASVDYDAALDAALCHGWIDGQRRSLDANHFLQRFTPRRPRSVWSRRNVNKVAVLDAAGRMTPRGRAEVDAARADGRWESAYAGSATIEVPADFKAALDAVGPEAVRFFDGLTKAQRYPFLVRLETAKKPETRQRRIEQFVALLAQGKTL